jgi:hypothetical protein
LIVLFIVGPDVVPPSSVVPVLAPAAKVDEPQQEVSVGRKTPDLHDIAAKHLVDFNVAASGHSYFKDVERVALSRSITRYASQAKQKIAATPEGARYAYTCKVLSVIDSSIKIVEKYTSKRNLSELAKGWQALDVYLRASPPLKLDCDTMWDIYYTAYSNAEDSMCDKLKMTVLLEHHGHRREAVWLAELQTKYIRANFFYLCGTGRDDMTIAKSLRVNCELYLVDDVTSLQFPDDTVRSIRLLAALAPEHSGRLPSRELFTQLEHAISTMDEIIPVFLE